jgi:hypothetical protein
MSNIFHLGGAAPHERRCLKSIAARRGKLDVLAAAMLSGGASGSWEITRAFSSRAARDAEYAQAVHTSLASADGERQRLAG